MKMNLLIRNTMWTNGTRVNQLFFAIILTLPLLSFGMVQGWIAPMIPKLQSEEGPSSAPYTNTQIALCNSLIYVTAISLGAPLGYLIDRFGRKRMTLITISCLCVYWLIKIISLEPTSLMIAKLVAGFPCSACFVIIPTYVKEVTDIDLRGIMGSTIILSRNIGYLSSYVAGDFLSLNGGLLFGILVPILSFVIMLLMPESPEYLVKCGKIDEAKSVLAWLRGVSTKNQGLEQDIDKMINAEKTLISDTVSPWKVIIHDPPSRKAFFIAVVVRICQQFDGYLIALIYSSYVFEKASKTINLGLTPSKQIVMVGVVNLLGSVFATSMLEKTGRKLLLVATAFAVGLSMATLAGWFYATSVDVMLPGWIPLLGLCLCIFADAGGYQPTSYIIITDLFTFKLRGSVLAFSNVCSRVVSFIQMMWFNDLCLLIGFHWTFAGVACVSFFSAIYIFILFPETKNKTIEEIYEDLSGKRKKAESEGTP